MKRQIRRLKMKNSTIQKGKMLRSGIILAAISLLFAGCVSRKVHILEKETAKLRINEPILVFPPLTSNPRLNTVTRDLGKYYSVEVPKRVNGPVIFASNIDALESARTWNNLIKNGTVNTMEAATIGKTVGCNSVLTCQILELQQYPPFRIVVQLYWIDSETGNILGKLYQDVDISDSETSYRYSNFVGQGVSKEVYEQIFYSADRYHSAYLMPQEFYRFVAAYTSNVLFGEIDEYPWWLFWRTFG
jgi:hypothetical protein